MSTILVPVPSIDTPRTPLSRIRESRYKGLIEPVIRLTDEVDRFIDDTNAEWLLDMIRSAQTNSRRVSQCTIQTWEVAPSPKGGSDLLCRNTRLNVMYRKHLDAPTVAKPVSLVLHAYSRLNVELSTEAEYLAP